MDILVLNERTTQAKLVLKPGSAIIKVPDDLPTELKTEVRNKLIRIADLNEKNHKFLKMYYKVGTPYMFLNKRVNSNKKETVATYKYSDL